MAARKTCNGLIYIRRSTSRQELSLPAQLDWALKEAARVGVAVDASLADLEYMLANGLVSYKSIRLDDGCTGADMERPGFVALQKDALADKAISHIFIYKRDRLARPQEAIDMIQIEKKLRYAGITMQLSGNVGAPLDMGQANLVVDMELYLEYYESGETLRKLSERVIIAQKTLAEGGHRTGGKPPYGFARVLVDASGNVRDELRSHQRVREPGCHVRIVPKDAEKIRTWIMILDLRFRNGWGVKRIAAHLNALRIPSPDAGCTRKDHGVPHYVSGKWSPGAVADLCRNPAIIGIQFFGRRLEGAHRRHGADGPRLLQEEELNSRGKPKTINNDSANYISRPTGAEAQYDIAQWQELQAEIDRRGSLQRGIPRTKHPERYPLACRVFDQTDGCGSAMYGRTKDQRRIYICGRYCASAGSDCEANWVDAEALLRFAMKTLRQVIGLDAQDHQEIVRLLKERARQERVEPDDRLEVERASLQHDLAELEKDLATARRRMAIEKSDARYQALAEEFDRLRGEKLEREQKLQVTERRVPVKNTYNPDEEAAAAIALLDQIDRVTSDEAARLDILQLFVRLGVRIGLNFMEATKGEKRKVRRLANGVMVFGNEELPVPVHGKDRLAPAGGQGRTGKNHQENARKEGDGSTTESSENAAAGTALSAAPALCDARLCERRPQEGISSTKDGRGGRI